MARFVAKHLVFLLLTLVVVSFLVFALNEFSPGAVARKELGAYATQEQVDLLTRQLGLDRPLPVRYAEYLGKAATGDLGYFLASIFVVALGWLPGTATLVAGGGWSIASQLVLPVAVIVLFDSGYVVSMIRASMIEVMQRPYIRTAVLKGMSFRRVVGRHALRNAMINPVTVILLQINYLISGVVVVETVFAYPGFGRMILEAALFKDIALIEAGALVAVGVAVLTQILGDLAYMLLDPRIRA